MDEVTNALIAGISAKVKLLAENGEAHLGAVGNRPWRTSTRQSGLSRKQDRPRPKSRATRLEAHRLASHYPHPAVSATALCMVFIGGAYYGASGRTAERAPQSALAAWALTPSRPRGLRAR